MYEAEIDTVIDATIGALAARAARYPVVMKRAQQRIIRKGPAPEPPCGDPGIRWLLLNTQQTNRCLRGTV
jgi:hypothetical protein